MNPGGLHRFLRSDEPKLVCPGKLFQLFLCKESFRPVISDLRSDFARVFRGIKQGDRSDTRLTAFQGMKKLLYVFPDRTEYPNSCNGNSFRIHFLINLIMTFPNPCSLPLPKGGLIIPLWVHFPAGGRQRGIEGDFHLWEQLFISLSNGYSQGRIKSG